MMVPLSHLQVIDELLSLISKLVLMGITQLQFHH